MRTRVGTLAHQSKSGEPEFVMVEFPSDAVFSRGFPKGYVVERTLTTNVRKINAVRLLDWLYENGYSTYTAKQLVQQTKNYERLEASITRMFDPTN
jgi:hypothetical protein